VVLVAAKDVWERIRTIHTPGERRGRSVISCPVLQNFWTTLRNRMITEHDGPARQAASRRDVRLASLSFEDEESEGEAGPMIISQEPGTD
jgi:hypothetical protein